ncbi:hypothetical protein L0244_36470 [bacterium]|nr:hypothetical protein [bacterium]
MKGKGPEYSLMEISKSAGRSYMDIAIDETAEYHSQFFPEWITAFKKNDRKEIARVLTSGDWPYFIEPLRFMLAKSHVSETISGDIFEGIGKDPIALVMTDPVGVKATDFRLGNPWDYYHYFYARHGLTHLETLQKPTVTIKRNGNLTIPLQNTMNKSRTILIRVKDQLPDGWKEQKTHGEYTLAPFSSAVVDATLQAPDQKSIPVQIRFEALENSKVIGETGLFVAVVQITTPF